MNKLTNFLVPTKGNKYKPYLLRKVAIITYSFILIFVNSFGGLLGVGQVQASNISPANVISLTNQERVGWGLNTLNTNAQLSAAALAKANDMFEKQYWDHFGPNGESPWQFIREAGYNYVYAGENLAKGFRTAEGIHEAWMASPTHKANIISGNYKDIGVAVVEGVLLGKETTLVVQMFGNLTSEVHGAVQEPVVDSTPSTPTPPPPSSERKVVVNNEAGEIKSIRITSPQEGAVLMDPSSNVKGETENVSGQYTVEVYSENDLLGDATSDSSDWEFSKDSDWSEGEHTIKAKLKGEDISSEEVTFSLDSKPPVIDATTITVKKVDGIFTISFMVDGQWSEIKVVIGSEIIDIDHPEKTSLISFQLLEEQVKGTVTVVISDEYGNTSELDISEYFIEQENEGKRVFPLISLGIGETISIGIVSLVLILLVVEIFVYWRRGKLREVVGEMFTIGAWWLVLTIALFNGFSGVIN